jgi:NADPH:quinone reductase-like Zn-dependent oxidoreductase
VRAGSAVTEYKVGDRVFPGLGSGTFREEVRCKAAACMPAPPGDAVQLSLLTVNGPTAEVLLEDFADLKPGDWLLQNGVAKAQGYLFSPPVSVSEAIEQLQQQEFH